MKMAIEKATGKVLYLDESLHFRDNMLYGQGFMDSRMSPSTCEIIDSIPPQPWMGAGWKYDFNSATFTQEQWWADKYAEEEAVRQRAAAKKARGEAVEKLLDTTANGKEFNGDEVAQTRMARAILALQAANQESTTWVLADNTATTVTIAELKEALILAGQAQTNVWVI